MLQAALLIAWVAGISTACSAPDTDILAVSSEGVGAWDVAQAQVDGTTLTADVCISDLDVADAVSHRLLMQLKNKGYERIDLAMYATAEGGGARVEKVAWTPDQGKQMQQGRQAAQNPCARRDAADAPTAAPPNHTQ